MSTRKKQRPRRIALDSHILYEPFCLSAAQWDGLERRLDVKFDESTRTHLIAAANKYIESMISLSHGGRRAALIGRRDANGERVKTPLTDVGLAAKRVHRVWGDGRPDPIELQHTLWKLIRAWCVAARDPEPAAPATTMLDEIASQAFLASKGRLDLRGFTDTPLVQVIAISPIEKVIEKDWLSALVCHAELIAEFLPDAWETVRERHRTSIVDVCEPETIHTANHGLLLPILDPFVGWISELKQIAERVGLAVSARGDADIEGRPSKFVTFVMAIDDLLPTECRQNRQSRLAEADTPDIATASAWTRDIQRALTALHQKSIPS